MKLRTNLLLIMLSCISISTCSTCLAQSSRLKYIGVEAGINSINAEVNNLEYIRYSYSYGYPVIDNNDNITSICTRAYTGTKFEILSNGGQLGLSSGIRYSRFHKELVANDDIDNNYFYYITSTGEDNTEYLRVNKLIQNSNYLGIPFEFKVATTKNPHFVRFVFKASIDFNFLINNNNDVKFHNNAMNEYKNQVTNTIKDPDQFYASLSLGGGLRIGKTDKPSVTIEGLIPCLYFSDGYGLNRPDSGVGMQIDFQIPLK